MTFYSSTFLLLTSTVPLLPEHVLDLAAGIWALPSSLGAATRSRPNASATSQIRSLRCILDWGRLVLWGCVDSASASWQVVAVPRYRKYQPVLRQCTSGNLQYSSSSGRGTLQNSSPSGCGTLQNSSTGTSPSQPRQPPHCQRSMTQGSRDAAGASGCGQKLNPAFASQRGLACCAVVDGRHSHACFQVPPALKETATWRGLCNRCGTCNSHRGMGWSRTVEVTWSLAVTGVFETAKVRSLKYREEVNNDNLCDPCRKSAFCAVLAGHRVQAWSVRMCSGMP